MSVTAHGMLDQQRLFLPRWLRVVLNTATNRLSAAQEILLARSVVRNRARLGDARELLLEAARVIQRLDADTRGLRQETRQWLLTALAVLRIAHTLWTAVEKLLGIIVAAPPVDPQMDIPYELTTSHTAVKQARDVAETARILECELCGGGPHPLPSWRSVMFFTQSIQAWIHERAFAHEGMRYVSHLWEREGRKAVVEARQWMPTPGEIEAAMAGKDTDFSTAVDLLGFKTERSQALWPMELTVRMCISSVLALSSSRGTLLCPDDAVHCGPGPANRARPLPRGR